MLARASFDVLRCVLFLDLVTVKKPRGPTSLTISIRLAFGFASFSGKLFELAAPLRGEGQWPQVAFQNIMLLKQVFFAAEVTCALSR